MSSPITTGSQAIELVHPSEVRRVVGAWGLDDEIFEDAYHDIHNLVETAIEDGVFIAQGLVYKCCNDEA